MIRFLKNLSYCNMATSSSTIAISHWFPCQRASWSRQGKVVDVTGNTGCGTGEHLSKLLTSVLIHGSVL